MSVRLKDIAQDLGVSIVTVSKALRNHPDIADATRERILEQVKLRNYRPNLMARSLVTGKSSLIGLVVPDLIHPFFSEIAKSLSGALRKKGYFLIVSSSDGDPLLEEEEIQQMLSHRLDCLVVASCQQNAESLRTIGEDVPLILLDRIFPGFASNFIGANDLRIGELATEHLIALGRKRIAHIRGPENKVGQSRLKGYREALKRHGLPAPGRYVVRPEGPADSDGEVRGRSAMTSLLSLDSQPDAIFCFNDMIAIGAMEKAFEMGLRVPADIAVIGCGNYHYCSKLRVPLSSIDQHVEELGLRTATMISALLQGAPEGRAKRVVLEPELIVRESSSWSDKNDQKQISRTP